MRGGRAQKRVRYLIIGAAVSVILGAVSLHCSGEDGTCSPAKVNVLASVASKQHARYEVTSSVPTKPDEQLLSTFEHIYTTRTWGEDGNGSGTGSTLNATIGIRDILFQAITDLNINSMIDIPCGAMMWMPVLLEKVESTNSNFRYMGMDIASSVIERNKQVFHKKGNWKFAFLDLTSQALPRGYDLIHTRDALQHLSCRHVVAALQNLANSGAKYLLVGSYNFPENKDIKDGDYFDLNLRVPPYSLSKPLAVFEESPSPGPLKYMLLYSIPELQQEDFFAMKLRCLSRTCHNCH